MRPLKNIRICQTSVCDHSTLNAHPHHDMDSLDVQVDHKHDSSLALSGSKIFHRAACYKVRAAFGPGSDQGNRRILPIGPAAE